MAAYTTNAYKNEKRRQAKSLVREGMFVADYVQTKYSTIYKEAAQLYNKINKLHPRKPDLRRTTEYREWKNKTSIQQNKPTTSIPRQKNRQYVHIIHRDIPLDIDPNIHTDISITESPRPARETPQKTMELRIPLIQLPTTPKANQNPQESIQTEYTETVIDERHNPSVPCQYTETVTDEENEILDTMYTETVIAEGDEPLNPSMLDQVSPEIIDKIITDLQQDPNIKDMMTDIENQMNMEEETTDLEIDIPDIDDLLEEELRNIIW